MDLLPGETKQSRIFPLLARLNDVWVDGGIEGTRIGELPTNRRTRRASKARGVDNGTTGSCAVGEEGRENRYRLSEGSHNEDGKKRVNSRGRVWRVKHPRSESA